MNNKMVERCARAICREYWAGAYHDAMLDQVVEQDWPQWDRMAKAALQATGIGEMAKALEQIKALSPSVTHGWAVEAREIASNALA